MKEDWVVCGEADNGDAAIELVRTVKPHSVVTSASLQDPNSGNTATVNGSGVQITTANGIHRPDGTGFLSYIRKGIAHKIKPDAVASGAPRTQEVVFGFGFYDQFRFPHAP
jgi:hypothetical protein